ncbi:MAG: smalltalk protein [Bacteroides sp.]
MNKTKNTMPTTKETLKKWINIVITILTAIASTLFVQSCYR